MIEASAGDAGFPPRPSVSATARPVPYGLASFTLATAATLVWVWLGSPRDSRIGAACLIVAGLAVVGLILKRRRANGRFVFEPPVLVVIVLFVWHFAFWPIYYLGFSTGYRRSQYLDFAPNFTSAAFFACLVAVLAVIAGVEAGIGAARWQTDSLPASLGRGVYVAAGIGAALIAGYFVVRGRSLVGQYTEVFTEEDTLRRLYNLGIVLVLGAIAPVFLSERNPRKRAAFLLLVALPAIVISMYLGSRWVLFSAVLIGLAARNARGARGGVVRVMVLAVILISVGTVIKETRQGTVAGVSDVPALLLDRYTNPFVEFGEEIGQTFLPVAGTVELTTRRDKHLYGESLVSPIVTVIPSIEELGGFQIYRPVREFAAEYFPEQFVREGFTIGYSIIAELYLNFGVLGVLLGMSVFGYTLGRTYRLAVESRSAAWLFVVWAIAAFAMFGVRNDAYTWLRFAVWGAIAYWVLGRALQTRRARAGSRQQPAQSGFPVTRAAR